MYKFENFCSIHFLKLQNWETIVIVNKYNLDVIFATLAINYFHLEVYKCENLKKLHNLNYLQILLKNTFWEEKRDLFSNLQQSLDKH